MLRDTLSKSAQENVRNVKNIKVSKLAISKAKINYADGAPSTATGAGFIKTGANFNGQY